MFRFLDSSRRSGGASRSSILRDTSGRALKRLDLDAAFFWLILVFLLTVLAFFSLRPPHVALDARQMAEYERRTQFLANSTVYIVEVGRPENLLSKLPAANWQRVSRTIDFVAFVFDDLQLFLTDNWVEQAEVALRDPSKPHASRVANGLGVGLFPCGCVLPNEWFVRVKERLDGLECTLLPGWVLDSEDVHWLDVSDPSAKRCKRRSHALDVRAARTHAASLQAIRKRVLEISAEMSNSTDVVAGPVQASAKIVTQPVAVTRR